MPILTARLLGPPSLCDTAGTIVRIPSAKAAVLLYYLVVNRQVHSRDRLAGMLWPDVPDRKAQASLRTALYELRKALGPETAAVLFVDRTRIGLRADVQTDCDVSTVEAVATLRSDDEGEVEALEAAVGSYRGPFLDGVHLDGAFDVEDWLYLERERLASLHATALCRLAERHAASGMLESAIELTRRLLAIDPLREDVHRALMRYLAMSGQRSAALAQYAACVNLLLDELGVEPLSATTELFEQIRDSRELALEKPGPTPLQRAVLQTATAPEALHIAGECDGPMIGRSSELDTLRELWSKTVAGGDGLMVIEGVAGVGKSRLLAELIATIAADGIVLPGRCHEATVAEPYGPIVTGLRAALPAIDVTRLGLAPVWLRQMSRLVPELGVGNGADTDGPLDGIRDRDRLFEAVRAFLKALSALRPVMLVAEDVHWSDETSLSLLRYLTREPRVPGLMVALTCRSEELYRERRAHVRSLANSGSHVVLRDLGAGETAELVGCISKGETLPESFGGALHRATGGNPLFVVETLRSLFEQRSLEADENGWTTTRGSARGEYAQLPIPESVAAIVSARLDRLDDDARHLLDCAAVLRRDFEFDTVAAASKLPPAEALDALDALLAAGLLREQPAEAGALTAGYDFVHALVRDIVYEGLSGARRQYLHRLTAGLLEAATCVQPERVAYHYLRGGVRDRACQWSLRAGDAALALYAGEDALVHFRSALELAVGAEEELAALSGLGDAFVSLGRHGEAVRSFTAALEKTGSVEPRADLHRRIGRAHERQGAYDRALGSFGDARQMLQGRPLSMTSIRIADSLATVYVRLGRHEEGAELCRDGLRWLTEHPDVAERPEAEAWLSNTLGLALMNAGEFGRALASLQQSLDLKRHLDDKLGEATLRNNLGVLHYCRGDDEAAREHYAASLEIKTAIGDTYGRAIALTNLALIETHLARYEAAGQLLEQAAAAADDSGAAWLEPEIARVSAQRYLDLGQTEEAMCSASASLVAAESLGVPSFIGVAHRMLGLVKARSGGDMAEADEHFLTSLAVFEMLRNDHELAKTHASYGEALIDRGRSDDAAEHLRAAAEEFARSGAEGRLRRLDALSGPRPK